MLYSIPFIYLHLYFVSTRAFTCLDKWNSNEILCIILSFNDIVISYMYTLVCLCVCMFAMYFLFICALERGNKERY